MFEEQADPKSSRLEMVGKASAFLLGQNNQDFLAQLYAIKGALQRNRDAEARLLGEFTHLREQQDNLDPEDHRNWEYFNDNIGAIIEESVYFDAAHSMAAVGMLAPYYESLFTSIFRGLGQRAQDSKQAGARALSLQELYWNPQVIVSEKRTKEDLVNGILELSNESSLIAHLPKDLEKTLKALFAYRNNMFHNGFEWPLDIRMRFQRRIENNHWPESWFEKSDKGRDPWIFYMSDIFVDHCIETIDRIFEGLGKYLLAKGI